MRRSLVNAVAILVLLAIVTPVSAQRRGPSMVGKEFPNFSATDPITGKKFELKDFRGKVVVVDFWATWCGPCVKELPNVQKAYRKYHDKGLEVISISLDSDRNRFKQFVAQKKMNWYHVMDGGGWSTRLAKKYKITSIPRMFVVGTDGKVFAANARGRALERAIEQALAGDTPREPQVAGDWSNREVLAKLDEALVKARAKLDAVSGPIDTRADRLTAAGRLLGLIERPSGPGGSPHERYAETYEALSALRAELFADGMLNDRLLELAPNPFDPSARDGGRQSAGSATALRKTRTALADMGLVVGMQTGAVRKAKKSLDRVDRARSRQLGDPVQLLAQVRELTSELEAVPVPGRSWQAQLDSAPGVLERLAGPDRVRSVAPSLRKSIDAIRADLEKGDDPDRLLALQERFVAACRTALDGLDA